MLLSVKDRYLNHAFRDLRLVKRYKHLLDIFSRSPGLSIPQAAGNKAVMKAVYRFFHNPKVSAQVLIRSSLIEIQESLLNSPPDQEPLLCLSDSTELDYTGCRSGTALGPLTYKKRRGMILHNSLLVEVNGAPLGMLDQTYLIRKARHFGKAQRKKRKRAPIETKESRKWLDHFHTAQQLAQSTQRQIIYVADREADMMPIFHAKQTAQMHYVIRCQFNRCLDQDHRKLYELIDEQPLAKTFRINIPHPVSGKNRSVELALRFCRARVKLSGNLKRNAHLSPIYVNLVEVKQTHPSLDGSKPIHWRLISSLAVENVEDAMRIVNYYTKRWIIERFHYLLKSGAVNIEQLQLQKAHTVKNAIATYSNAVMDIMKIKYWAEHQPQKSPGELGITDEECTVLFQYASQKQAKIQPYDPDNPPTIKQFCIVLGQIAGFIPSKRQPLPGLKILARAMTKFDTLIEAYRFFKDGT